MFATAPQQSAIDPKETVPILADSNSQELMKFAGAVCFLARFAADAPITSWVPEELVSEENKTL
jgi:hypothetical protein